MSDTSDVRAAYIIQKPGHSAANPVCGVQHLLPMEVPCKLGTSRPLRIEGTHHLEPAS